MWELIGLMAVIVIVVSLPVYYFSVVKDASDSPAPPAEPTFVGSVECKDCHNLEYDKWLGSHHDFTKRMTGFMSIPMVKVAKWVSSKSPIPLAGIHYSNI